MSSKKGKWLLLVLAIVVIGGYAGYRYAYQPHETTENKEVDYSGSSNAFLEKVSADANVWLNKAVEISGNITAIDEKGITLSENIYCQFREDNVVQRLQKGQKIRIKGVVIGYDDLLEELKLNQCIIQK